MIKNIIFDWSGVINNNLQTVYHAAMIIFQRYGAPKISLGEFRKEWEQPYMIFYNKYLPRLSKKEEGATFPSAYKTANFQHPPKPYSHIQDTLQKFKKAGIKMVIISSDPLENLISEIKKFSLQKLFIEINGDVYDKIEIIQETIKRNKFNPRKTILVGDTTHDIKAGKSVGTKTVAVSWGYQGEDKLKSTNPDFIVHNLKELEKIILD